MTKFLSRLLGVAILAAVIASFWLPPLTRGEQAVICATNELGKKYVFHTKGPDTYDCSGLILYAYENAVGIELPHSAMEIGYNEEYPTITKASQLRPGDLIFFDTVRDKDECDHVGIWMGMNRFVHASSSKKVVMISEFDENWQKKFSWGKRLISPWY